MVNNEVLVQEEDEYACWPFTGSDKIDMFEYYGNTKTDFYTFKACKIFGYCIKDDWWNISSGLDALDAQYHEYPVELKNNELVYRLDGKEGYNNEGDSKNFNYMKPIFAIHNYTNNGKEKS